METNKSQNMSNLFHRQISSNNSDCQKNNNYILHLPIIGLKKKEMKNNNIYLLHAFGVFD